jgi:hypothetical protein
MKNKIFIYVIATLYCQTTLASAFMYSLNCAGKSIVFSKVADIGGPVPPPGTRVGQWTLSQWNQVIDSENLYAGQGPDVPPACDVQFDQESKVPVLADGSVGNESVSTYRINLHATCEGGANSGKQYSESVVCTEGRY